MRRDELPAECFTHRGKIKVRNALRHLYNTRDLIPADGTLCNLWATNDDSVTPKRIGRERSRLTCASGEGYRLEKTDGGKWRVVRRPNRSPVDLFGYGEVASAAESPAPTQLAQPAGDEDVDAVIDRLVGGVEAMIDRVLTARITEAEERLADKYRSEYRLFATNLVDFIDTGVVDRLIGYWEAPPKGRAP